MAAAVLVVARIAAADHKLAELEPAAVLGHKLVVLLELERLAVAN